MRKFGERHANLLFGKRQGTPQRRQNAETTTKPLLSSVLMRPHSCLSQYVQSRDAYLTSSLDPKKQGRPKQATPKGWRRPQSRTNTKPISYRAEPVQQQWEPLRSSTPLCQCPKYEEEGGGGREPAGICSSSGRMWYQDGQNTRSEFPIGLRLAVSNGDFAVTST